LLQRETAKTTSVETKTVLVDYTASIALVGIKSKTRPDGAEMVGYQDRAPLRNCVNRFGKELSIIL
jgi:hypothetical protein